MSRIDVVCICFRSGKTAGIRWITGYQVEVSDGIVIAVGMPDGWTDPELRRDAVNLGEWEPAVGARVPHQTLEDMRAWREEADR